MRPFKRFVLAFIAGAAISFPNQAYAVIEIVDSIFGTVSNLSSKTLRFTHTTVIPAIPGTSFGWTLSVRVGGKPILLREEFELPEPPPTWGENEARGIYYISPDRRTAVTERLIGPETKTLYQIWNYVPGDPIGPHAIRIYFDGILVREYTFDIIEPKVGFPAEMRKVIFGAVSTTP